MKINIDDVIRKLRVYIAEKHNGKQIEFAKSIEVSNSFISAVMKKKKKPTKEILDLIDVRVKRVSFYSYEEKTGA